MSYFTGMLWTTYQRTANNWYTAELFDTRLRITTFGQDNAGEIYAGDADEGVVYRLVSSDG